MQTLVSDDSICTRNCAVNAPQANDPIKRRTDIATDAALDMAWLCAKIAERNFPAHWWQRANAPLLNQAPLLSINSPMRPCTEPDNAETQRREDSNINQCINHGSLH